MLSVEHVTLEKNLLTLRLRSLEGLGAFDGWSGRFRMSAEKHVEEPNLIRRFSRMIRPDLVIRGVLGVVGQVREVRPALYESQRWIVCF